MGSGQKSGHNSNKWFYILDNSVCYMGAMVLITPFVIPTHYRNNPEFALIQAANIYTRQLRKVFELCFVLFKHIPGLAMTPA